jgi:uncharacterized Fe-S center protein
MANEVYFARLADGAGPAAQADALERALRPTGFVEGLRRKDMVAIKVHVGEKNNETHIRPELVKRAALLVREGKGQPFVTDTSTLYRGQRENGIRHAMLAHAHGFGIDRVGAPFIPLDGLSGNHEAEVEIAGELDDRVKVAGEVLLTDAMIVITHVTAHIGTGLGGAIKNVGMGLSSRAGKMRQHSTIKPEIIEDTCTNCGKCRRWCPQDAISERDGVSLIAADLCIGCGECLAVCRYGAVKYDFKVESPLLQKRMAEHTAGVLKHITDKAVFANVMVDQTRECDCLSKKQEKAFRDLGILVSRDIVAVDRATLDITGQAYGKDISVLGHDHLDPRVQIEHGEKIGLGSTKYDLVEV